MITWGVIWGIIGIAGMSSDVFDVLFLALGIAMALAGAVFKSQRSLGVFVAEGVAFLLLAFWNFGMVLLQMLIGRPTLGRMAFLALMGLFMIFLALSLFRRGAEFRRILGGWSTVSSPGAVAFVNRLLSLPPNSPELVFVRVGSGKVGVPWRAAVGDDFLFAVDLPGMACFWVPLGAVEQALAGQPVAIGKTGRMLFLEPAQAQKIRQILWDRATSPST
jgi:hypothetical protein